DDPLPTGAHLGAREAPRRLHRGARPQPGDGAPVDRGAVARRRARGQGRLPQQGERLVRHPPAHRRPHRRAPRAVTTDPDGPARPGEPRGAAGRTVLGRRAFVAGLLATPVLAACSGGGDDATDGSAAPGTEGTVATTATTVATTTTAPPVLAPLTGAVFAGDP